MRPMGPPRGYVLSAKDEDAGETPAVPGRWAAVGFFAVTDSADETDAFDMHAGNRTAADVFEHRSASSADSYFNFP